MRYLLFLLLGTFCAPICAQAPPIVDQRLDSLLVLPDNRDKLVDIYNYGRGCYNDGQDSLAYEVFVEAADLAETIGDTLLIIKSEYMKGAAAFYLDRYDESIEHHTSAAHWARLFGDHERHVNNRFEVAYNHAHTGNLLQANNELVEISRLLKAADTLFLVRVDHQLARNHLDLGELAAARSAIERSVATARLLPIEQVDRLIKSLLTQSNILLAANELILAERAAREAVVLVREHRNVNDKVNAHNMLGSILTNLGRYDEADREFAVILQHDDRFYPSVTINLAALRARQGRWAESRQLLYDSEEYFLQERAEAHDRLAMIYDQLAMYELSPAQIDTFMKYTVKVARQRDSVVIKANRAATLELEERYAASDREAEITAQAAQLRYRRNILWVVGGLLALAVITLLGFYILATKLRHRNARNEELVREKEALIGEVHHRVKNNLQTISSLLRLQSRQLEDPAAVDALRQSRTRVETMGLIHQRLYQHDNVTSVNIHDYLTDLCDTLVDTYRLDARIRMLYSIDPDLHVAVDQAVSLGLIVNELITNSLKYAFPDGRAGKIQVSVTHRNDTCLAVIADDGIGKQFPGVHAGGTGFGTRLIEMMVKKLKGTISYPAGGGMNATIEFPVVVPERSLASNPPTVNMPV